MNCYIITSCGETLIVDAGFDHPASRSAIEGALKALSIDKDRASLLFTHFHSDHTGTAAGILPPSRPRYIGEIDKGFACSFSRENGQAHFKMLLEEGVPAQMADEFVGILMRSIGNLSCVDPIGLRDGDVLQVGDCALRVVHTPGHTPGHICLYQEDQRLVFSGDHILFDMSANVCHLPEHPHMLASFIGALRRIAALPVAHCFTAHHGNGDGAALRRRVEEIIAHHNFRIADVINVLTECPQGLSAFEIMKRIPWKARKLSFEQLNPMEAYFAQSETLSHLELLTQTGAIGRAACTNGFRYHLITGCLASFNRLSSDDLSGMQHFWS